MIKYFKELEKPNDFTIDIFSDFKKKKYNIKYCLKYEVLIKEALININCYKKLISKANYKKILLPNSWYILPKYEIFNESLYNTGAESHKESHLKTPFQYALNGKLNTLENFNFELARIQRKEKYLKAISKDYTNIEKILTIVNGNIIAEALLWQYFIKLREKFNYFEILEKLKGMLLDDFLIRCVGFHKVISVQDKIISTSDINYQENFYEYLSNGWTIDFVKPLAWSNVHNDFVEPENDMVKIMQFHDLK